MSSQTKIRGRRLETSGNDPPNYLNPPEKPQFLVKIVTFETFIIKKDRFYSVLLTRAPLFFIFFNRRLACIKLIFCVHPEPESNSHTLQKFLKIIKILLISCTVFPVGFWYSIPVNNKLNIYL